MPDLSVIIPALKHSNALNDVVGQLLRQRFQNFEILVVDQSGPAAGPSLSQTLRLRHPDPRLRVLVPDGPGLQQARNCGLAHATGQIVLFLCDKVVLLTDNFLGAHMSAYVDPDVGGVSGRVIDRAGGATPGRTVCKVTLGGRARCNLAGFTPARLQALRGVNMSFRAEVFRHVGGFDGNYPAGASLADAELSRRVARDGWALLFEPKAELLYMSAAPRPLPPGAVLARQCRDFQSTAYYIATSRGAAGLIPFALTFGAQAAVTALRCGRPGALPVLWRAARAGWRTRRDPDGMAIAIPVPAVGAAPNATLKPVLA